MDNYIVKGGKKLYGSVTIESAKNAVLPIMAASVLTDENVVIKNCPKIADVMNMVKILKHLGVYAEFCGKDLLINASCLSSYTVPEELTGVLRSSVFLLGPLLGRVKKACVAYPGGCAIGARPVDIHVFALRKIGALVTETDEYVVCSAEKTNDAYVVLPFPSVGATENVILASVLSDGVSVVGNCAIEPEVKDMVKFLNAMGADIRFSGSTAIIKGVKKLHGTVFTPISDRIEAGTFIIATAVCGGEIEIHNVVKENILCLTDKVCNNTCKIHCNNDIINVKSGGIFSSVNIQTGPYPCFPTDLQAQIMALCSVARGVSYITENIFENRFGHVSELNKMGADITVNGRTAVIKGVKRLRGAKVFARDLRGGAGLVIAALAAEGTSVIHGVKHIERGYFRFDEKLGSLGADIYLR